MRTYMTKEITKTTIKLAKMVVGENGLPTVEQLADVELLGDITKDRAQKLINKKHDEAVTVYAVETTTEKYKMKVTDFLKHAELVVDGDDEDEEEEDSEEEQQEESSTETKPKGKGKYITS